jgi:hypothetical protein
MYADEREYLRLEEGRKKEGRRKTTRYQALPGNEDPEALPPILSTYTKLITIMFLVL